MFYLVPTNLKYGEGFRIRKIEDENKLKSFLLNVNPNDYMIIEWQEIKAKKNTVIDLIRPQGNQEEE
jgi:hypothetical protein